MKKSSWFVCLSYGTFDILIPQTDVAESSYSVFNAELEKNQFDIDEIVKRIFSLPEDDKTQMHKKITGLKINDKKGFLTFTSIVPELINLCPEDFQLFSGNIGKVLLKKGIIAVRFCEDKIQYLVDVKKIKGK